MPGRMGAVGSLAVGDSERQAQNNGQQKMFHSCGQTSTRYLQTQVTKGAGVDARSRQPATRRMCLNSKRSK
jgi:hypothetical protein